MVNKKGFTLLELTVVMAILGVLATMMIGAYMASLKKGRDVRRKGDMAQVGKALELYFTDRGGYPLSSGGKIMGCGNPVPPSSPTDCSWGDKWSTTNTSPETVYMGLLPSDPKSDMTFYYESNGSYYQLYGFLENTDDPELVKSGGVIQTYQSTNCHDGLPAIECNWGVSSANTSPNSGSHTLH